MVANANYESAKVVLRRWADNRKKLTFFNISFRQTVPLFLQNFRSTDVKNIEIIARQLPHT